METADRQVNEENLTSQKKHIRKEQVLTQGMASVTRSIADAVVVKNENMYFLTRPDGSVPPEGNHGFGLYCQDCRYLNGYVLKIGRQKPNVLVADDEAGFAAVFELANPEISAENGGTIPMNEVGSFPYLLTVLLGLQPQAFDRRLHVVRPVLPDFVDWLQFRRLRVGDARVDLRFERASESSVAVEVLEVEGELNVVTETAARIPG